MNCANHPQNAVSAYCRTCGKPICNQCTRQVMGVIYCENCLAERVSGTAPAPAAFQPAPGYQPAVQPVSGGPNPALAGILAGFFPFGVGAVYCGQYAKGLAHLIVFVLLVIGASNATSDAMGTVFGLSIAAFYFYQLIDAIKTAKAIQTNQPVPDPFGLANMFSPGGGTRQDFSRGVPVGAVVLIGLGVLFLLHNLDIWFLRVDTLWPIVLIGLGLWLFARRRECIARGDYRHRSMAGPAVLITIGVLSLLQNLHERWWGVPGWHSTWPLILLVIGVIKLMERGEHYEGPSVPLPPPPSGNASTQQPSTEVNSEVKNG
jgi:TM2 domain-containing membrane protein YozV